MKPSQLAQLKVILNNSFNKKNNFYFDWYIREGITKKDIEKLDLNSFKLLPEVKISDLADAPFQKRCIDEKPGLNKLVFSKGADKYFLMHRTLPEIKNEKIPICGTRPMVIMQDVYNSIETCLFFYEHKILPLIGEVLNPAAIYSTASQYNIDSLYMDIVSFDKFGKELLKQKLPIKALTIIDSKSSLLSGKTKGIEINYLFSISEIGPIASLCPESSGKTLKFHALDDVYIEEGREAVITSFRLKACPIIRYKTNFSVKKNGISCSCNQEDLLIIGD